MPGGRPTKLTPELQEDIVKYLRLGNYVETVCAIVGINKTTFYDWMRQGARAKRSTNKMAQFSHAIKAAMALGEAADLAVIQQASVRSWQAAAWRLERRYPGRWGRKDVLGTVDIPDRDERDVTPQGRPDFSRLNVDELEQLESILEKAEGRMLPPAQGDHDHDDESGN